MMRILTLAGWGLGTLIWLLAVSLVVANPLMLLDVAESHLDRLMWRIEAWLVAAPLLWMASLALAAWHRPRLALVMLIAVPILWVPAFLDAVAEGEAAQYRIDSGVSDSPTHQPA